MKKEERGSVFLFFLSVVRMWWIFDFKEVGDIEEKKYLGSFQNNKPKRGPYLLLWVNFNKICPLRELSRFRVLTLRNH